MRVLITGGRGGLGRAFADALGNAEVTALDLPERSFDVIKQVHESGVAVLVVEQNANVSLSIADRGYVLSTGRLVLEGPAGELREDEDLRKAYLGR